MEENKTPARSVLVGLGQFKTRLDTESSGVDQSIGLTFESSNAASQHFSPYSSKEEEIKHLTDTLDVLSAHRVNVLFHLRKLLYGSDGGSDSASVLSAEDRTTVVFPRPSLFSPLAASQPKALIDRPTQIWPSSTVPVDMADEGLAKMLSAKDGPYTSLKRFGVFFNGFGLQFEGFPENLDVAIPAELIEQRSKIAGYVPPLLIAAKMSLETPERRLPDTSWTSFTRMRVVETKKYIVNKVLDACRGDRRGCPVDESQVIKTWGEELNVAIRSFVASHLEYGVHALISLGLPPSCAEFVTCLEKFISKVTEDPGCDKALTIAILFLSQMNERGALAGEDDCVKDEYIRGGREVWHGAISRSEKFWPETNTGTTIVDHRPGYGQHHREHRYRGAKYYFGKPEFDALIQSGTVPTLEPEPPVQHTRNILHRLAGIPEIFSMLCTNLDLGQKKAVARSSKALIPYIKAVGFTPEQKTTNNTKYQDWMTDTKLLADPKSDFCFGCGNFIHIAHTAAEKRAYAPEVANTEADPAFIGPRLKKQGRDGWVQIGNLYKTPGSQWGSKAGSSKRRVCMKCAGEMCVKYGGQSQDWFYKASRA